MSAATQPDGGPASPFPRVPGYAWAWFQRSRPVLTEAAQRLTGESPKPGFVDDLRRDFEADPFVRDVVVGVVADVAFNGRIPVRRPAGASWDRGLLWWAAAIAGSTPAEFDARSKGPQGTQRALFDTSPEQPPSPQRPARPAERERAAVARALRELLAAADGDQIPVSAVRALLAHYTEDRPPHR